MHFVRSIRILLVTCAATVLWGASLACETDSWNRRGDRVEVAPGNSGSADGSGTASQLPSVGVAERTESDLVQELMLHRAMYARYLKVLRDYYNEHGYINKVRWAQIELRDLRNVRPYCVTPEGKVVVYDRKHPMAVDDAPGLDLPSIKLAGRSELDLVEEMMLHRDMYGRNLNLLHKYYIEHGMENKANLIRAELNDRSVIKVYAYITENEAPSAPLKPLESIAEADRLFEQGQDLMSEGGHHVIIWYNNRTMKQALNKFKELVDKYPTSDKIDDAAYFIAEIHKEYNQERDNEIAIEWYKKAIAWNPELPYPAWSHTAHIYDFRMHEREKALEWYQLVLEHEKDKHGWRFARNIAVANKRIKELTNEETRYAPAELAGEPAPPTGMPPARSGGGTATEAAPKAPSVAPGQKSSRVP